jgi:hypothetical protein
LLATAIVSGVGFGAMSSATHRSPAKLTSRLPEGGTLISVACPAKLHCLAVGDDETRFGPRKQVGQWGGANWVLTVLRASKYPTGALLNAITCPSLRECIAVGAYYRYSGASAMVSQVFNPPGSRVIYMKVPAPQGGTGSKLTGLTCITVSNCFAVGYNQTRGRTFPVAEHWNGGQWDRERTPAVLGARTTLLTQVACAQVRHCLAVGSYVTDSGQQFALAEFWNGKTWRIVPTAAVSAPGGDELSGIACPAVTFCLAVGGYVNSSNPLSEIWNGKQWLDLLTPSPANQVASSFSDVYCRSVSDCTAVGYFHPSYHIYETLAEAWNGSNWQIQPTPNRSRISDLYSVSCPSSRLCIAVGAYSNLLGLRRTLVETRQGAGNWEIAP